MAFRASRFGGEYRNSPLGVADIGKDRTLGNGKEAARRSRRNI